MSSVFRLAKSTDELNDILHLRYLCLLASGAKVASQLVYTERYLDPLDILPNTLHIGGYSDGLCTASIRAAGYSAKDKLQNQWVRLDEINPTLTDSCYILDHLCLNELCKNRTGSLRQLLQMTMLLLSSHSVQKAFFLAPKNVVVQLVEMGFSQISEGVSVNQNELIPLLMDVAAFHERLIQNVIDKEIMRFQGVFYGTLFEAGEVIVVEGERGANAHILLDGSVDVIIKTPNGLKSIRSIEKGNLIGEVAMITADARTASLVAKTDCICLSFDRSNFMKLLYSEPHRSVDVFKILSKRLSESNKKLAAMGSSKT